MLRAVTFDFWNTLFEDVSLAERKVMRAALLRAELAGYGARVDDASLERAFAAAYESFERIWRGEHRTPSTYESMLIVCRELGVAPPDDTVVYLATMLEELVLEAPPEPVTGALETVAALVPDYSLALICDTGLSPGRVLRRILAAQGLDQQFQVLYFSDEGGMSKPDPRVFELVLGELGVTPGEAAHVGDIERTDIRGAHGAGMRAVHFVGVNDRDARESTADALIRAYEELPTASG